MPSGLTSIPKNVGTRRYGKFLDELCHAILAPDETDPLPLLNGKAGRRCIELLPVTSRRRLGAYFTPSETAARVASLLDGFEPTRSVAFDPACGAGDLLLPMAAMLPIRPDASATLRTWNKRLRGCDISADFVRSARLRLLLLAVTRGARLDGHPDTLSEILSNVIVQDGLFASAQYKAATHVVMNPPFGIVSVRSAVPWRGGQLTSAALFVEQAAMLCKNKTQIAALLPEVLRTGSSYARWRDHLGTLAQTGPATSLGLFSKDADVDVFMQRLVVNRREVSKRPRRKQERSSKRRVVGSKFRVCVGTVVPHRHAKNGPSVAYLHAGNATAWKEIQKVSERRQFAGTLFSPPFVVIRRTSRPGDPQRAISSLVLGSRPVAVENHLIVAIPKRGQAPLCRELVKRLRSEKVNTALDKTMRCRHLTVSSVSSLSW